MRPPPELTRIKYRIEADSPLYDLNMFGYRKFYGNPSALRARTNLSGLFPLFWRIYLLNGFNPERMLQAA